MKRQFKIGKYKVDLYIEDINIIIECDELGHLDRDKEYEETRQKFIENEGYNVIRFNPNDDEFDISSIINIITTLIFEEMTN